MSDSLIDRLDKAAEAILDRANGSDNLGDNIEGTGPPREKISLNDQIEAFKVVTQWAEKRVKLVPKEPVTKPGTGKFANLRSEFHGGAGRGRRGPKAPDETGLDA